MDEIVKSGWVGEWNADKTVFTGIYTALDGRTWSGDCAWTDRHVIVHSWPGMGEKRVESPVEPHWEFTGGGSIDPPAPDDRAL
jgi:hypothetical protein